MDIKEMKEKLGVSVALKVKRFCRAIRRPFIKTKMDFSAELYKNENEAVPAASVGGDYDTDIKLVDIIGVLAVFSLFCSLIKGIHDLFD